MKVHELQEARKNAELNPKVSVNQQIFNAMAQYKETFKANNLDIPNVFVSFTELPKLGINPLSKYKTPIGIYAYPASYIISELGNTLDPRHSLPFAGERRYANIFSLKSGSKVLVISNDENAQYMPYYEKLSAMFSKDDVDQLRLLGENGEPAYRAKIPNHMGGVFWFVTMKLANRLMRQRGMESMSVAWNYLFRKIGIQAVIDYGDGIIHENEPTQIVVFDTSAITNVKLVDNKYSKIKIERSVALGKEKIEQRKDANDFVNNNLDNPEAISTYLFHQDKDIRSHIISRLSPKIRMELIKLDANMLGDIKKPTEEEINLALKLDFATTLQVAGRFISTDKLISAIDSLQKITLSQAHDVLRFNTETPVLVALVKSNPGVIVRIYIDLKKIPTIVWKTAYDSLKKNPKAYKDVLEWMDEKEETINFSNEEK